jgi:hypothetical protein
LPDRYRNELWLVRDVERVGERLKELKNDEDGLRLFIDTLKKDVKEKQEHAIRCRIFIAELNNDRTKDLDDARSRRKDA